MCAVLQVAQETLQERNSLTAEQYNHARELKACKEESAREISAMETLAKDASAKVLVSAMLGP